MRLCYCLVTEGDDAYSSMAVVSIASARRVEPNARIILVVDDTTARHLERQRHRVLDVIDELVTVDVDPGLSQVMRSRLCKVRAWSRLGGDLLQLDLDTLALRPFLGELARVGGPFAASLDRNAGSAHPHAHRRAGVVVFKPLGWRFPVARYFNSGVILWRDTLLTGRLAVEWERRWRASLGIDVHFDQPALNSAVDAVLGPRATVLDVRFNAPVEVSAWFAPEARIAHFYANSRPMHQNVLGHAAAQLDAGQEPDWPALWSRVDRGALWIEPVDRLDRLLVQRRWREALSCAIRRLPHLRSFVRNKGASWVVHRLLRHAGRDVR